MAEARTDLSNKDEASLFEMFDYLCSKIDFGKSFLDNTAIVCMNELFIKLRLQKAKYKIRS